MRVMRGLRAVFYREFPGERRWAPSNPYLRARTDRPAKAMLISAQQAAAYYDTEKSRGAYPTVDAYLADIVEILRGEVEELVRLGCTYIQVDGPQYAALLDPQLREGYRQWSSDPDRLLDLCIEMDNAVVGDHPGILFALHVCRGNYQSKFFGRGDYGPIWNPSVRGTPSASRSSTP